MATKPMSDAYAATERGTNQSPRSAWWAELALGTVCSMTAVAYALGNTAIGPFSNVIITHPSFVSVAYLVLASCLGLVFIRAGYRHSPWGGESNAAEHDGTVDLSEIDEVVVSRPHRGGRPAGRSGERDGDR